MGLLGRAVIFGKMYVPLVSLLVLLLAAPVQAQDEQPQEDQAVEPPARLNFAAAALTAADLPPGFALDEARSRVSGEEPLDFHYAQYVQGDPTVVLLGQGPIVVGAGVAPALPVETVMSLLIAGFVQTGAEASPFDGVPAVKGAVWQKFSVTGGGIPFDGYIVAFPADNSVGAVVTLSFQGRASAEETAALVRIIGSRLGASLASTSPMPTATPQATARLTPATATPQATPLGAAGGGAATSQATPSPVATSTPAPTAAPAKLLLEDSFDDPTLGWLPPSSPKPESLSRG